MEDTFILVVNTNLSEIDVISKEMAQVSYKTVGASSLEEMDSAIVQHENIKLALLDLTGFDQSIWEHCVKLHEARIPFIIITPQRSPSAQRDSMKYGANGLLVKPLGMRELVEHIHTVLGD